MSHDCDGHAEQITLTENQAVTYNVISWCLKSVIYSDSHSHRWKTGAAVFQSIFLWINRQNLLEIQALWLNSGVI